MQKLTRRHRQMNKAEAMPLNKVAAELIERLGNENGFMPIADMSMPTVMSYAVQHLILRAYAAALNEVAPSDPQAKKQSDEMYRKANQIELNMYPVDHRSPEEILGELMFQDPVEATQTLTRAVKEYGDLKRVEELLDMEEQLAREIILDCIVQEFL